MGVIALVTAPFVEGSGGAKSDVVTKDLATKNIEHAPSLLKEVTERVATMINYE